MAAPEGLPPGFRFHPTDEELVGYYLKRKVRGLRIDPDIIPVVDNLYKSEPWELPEMSFMPSTDRPEWYLFGPRDRKYPNGTRTNRATPKGYWKSTGNDRPVLQHNGGGGGRAIVGMKKTLIYHEGRAPKGVRTDWVMNEYRLCDDSMAAMQLSSYALCRLFNKKAICTQIQVGMLPSSGSEGISSPSPPEVIAAVADDDKGKGNGNVDDWSWIDDHLITFDDDYSWIGYFLSNDAGGCSGAAAVADGDMDKGNVDDWPWTDDQLNIFEDDSWTDYFPSDDAGCSSAAPDG